jgi:hypothetical protein
MKIRATLTKILLISLMVASLAQAVQYWRSTTRIQTSGQVMMKWEKRLAPVKDALPFRQGIIGYVGEWDVPGSDYAYRDQEAEYLLAQYTLAPLILKKGAVAEWNVALLGAKSLSTWQAAFGESFQIMPLGRQVYLLHQVKSP